MRDAPTAALLAALVLASVGATASPDNRSLVYGSAYTVSHVLNGTADAYVLDANFLNNGTGPGVDIMIESTPRRGVMTMLLAPSATSPPSEQRIITHATSTNADGTAVSQTVHIPWCGGHTTAHLHVTVPGETQAEFTLSITVGTPNAASCIRMTPGQTDSQTLAADSAIAYTLTAPSTASASVNRGLRLSFSSAPLFSVMVDRGNRAFAPGFATDGVQSASLYGVMPCLVQCATGSFYEAADPSAPCASFATTEQYAWSTVTVLVATPSAVDFNVTFGVYDASDECFSTASYVKVTDPQSREAFDLLSYGLPLIACILGCSVFCARQQPIEATEEERAFMENRRKRKEEARGA